LQLHRWSWIGWFAFTFNHKLNRSRWISDAFQLSTKKPHAPLRVKTSNRAGFRAYSSCPVAVAQINASDFMPFYPQIVLQTQNIEFLRQRQAG
jgi:hypothetical protein